MLSVHLLMPRGIAVFRVCVMMERSSEQKDSLNVEQVFDAFSKRYDAWYDKPFGKSAFNLEKACIESLCKDLKHPFLEVGVGTGRFAKALEIEYGIDVSTRVLKFAKQREIIAVKGEGESLPFVDSFFGAVFMIVTLCFVDEPVKVLKEASRVLKEDGAAILGLILKDLGQDSTKKKARRATSFIDWQSFTVLKS
jgi:ubiquinone/menaquinone biosynthesis C-methylase UbiE